MKATDSRKQPYVKNESTIEIHENEEDEEVKNIQDNDAKQSAAKDDDEASVLVETDAIKTKVQDGGWGWMIVIGCLLLRAIIGGVARSSGLFYIKFLERFGGTASETAWVTSLSATVRLLSGPVVSVLCNRVSIRKLTFVGAVLYVIAIHISGYANSLLYMYFSYGVIAGIGRSFLLTPLTMLLGEFFDKRRSLAFGLASAGFGIGGFVITPSIEIMFQKYGFTGTYLLLSGIACNLFVCICLFRSPPKSTSSSTTTNEPAVLSRTEDNNSIANTDGDEEETFVSYISSTGSVHMVKNNGSNDQHVALMNDIEENKMSIENKEKKSQNKIFSFSVLKDIRFLTLCIATFIFTLQSTGLFIPALAKSRGVTDIQIAGLLSIIAGTDTIARVVAGFVLDLKAVRHLRPYIYNLMSFLQCIASFCFPSLQRFEHFVAVGILQGAVLGTKAAQRNVILVDILGLDNLPSSFALLLTVQGIGTLIGPPLSALLKDYYGKYDYSFYFGGSCVLLGAIILTGGNVSNYRKSLKTKNKKVDKNG